MAGLVAEDTHAFRVVPPSTSMIIRLEPHQARMRQIKRESDAGRVSG